MANRRISEFPAINGADIDEQDLMTLVHVFEVDPVLRNKKITFTQFRSYLDQYYATVTGDVFAGNVTITGNLIVNGDTSLNTVTSSGLATFSGVVVQNNLSITGSTTGVSATFTNQISGQTVTGTTAHFTSGIFQDFTAVNQTFSGTQTVSGDLFVLSGVFVTGSGLYVNNTITGATFTGISGTFTSQISGATVTGDIGKFTNITGQTLALTTPSGATPAMVCSGVVSGGTNGFVIQGPLIILP